MANEQISQHVTPYLTVNGGAEAIAFYVKALGATEKARMPADDGKRLMHAEISVNGGTVMLADAFPEYGGDAAILAPSAEKPASVAIVLAYEAAAEVDSTFKRAVDAGCTGVMPPEDAFWGSRFAMMRDPFGHRWMLSAPLAK